jgi:hypothetical protein
LSGDKRKYAILLTPISGAIVLSVSARSLLSLPRIVSVSRAVADSMLMAVSSVLLRFNIEDPQHDFVARMSDHPARLGVYSTRDVAAEFKQLNADAV